MHPENDTTIPARDDILAFGNPCPKRIHVSGRRPAGRESDGERERVDAGPDVAPMQRNEMKRLGFGYANARPCAVLSSCGFCSRSGLPLSDSALGPSAGSGGWGGLSVRVQY